ncbi:hypothetical protein [Corallibacter sp.]|uniref:hypothetical protein n=1 Tax=Corallibacter sp. TaxID=2038084 RepID=UPI003AB3000E
MENINNQFHHFFNKEEETIKEFERFNQDVTIDEIKNEGFNRYDCNFTSGYTQNGLKRYVNGLCEVKTRQCSFEKYKRGGILIELDKLNAIMGCVAKEKNKEENMNKTIKGFYLSKYNDQSFLFDLESVNLQNIHYTVMPKVTATNEKEYVHKAVIYLNHKEAIYTY